MRFALITADKTHGRRFRIDPEEGDATSFLNWVDVWGGFHFNFDLIMDQLDLLKMFDVVMMSGHPAYLVQIAAIARHLKDSDTVSMFYPEGSVQLYDNSINGFYSEYYDAINACDILSPAEEDKVEYYKNFIRSETVVKFIHVPMRKEMERGDFLKEYQPQKMKGALVYGDNNPNHPLIAIACATRASLEVVGVDIDRGGKLEKIKGMFPNTVFYSFDKLAQNNFLRLLGKCAVCFYPTEWIGTARMQISCAVAGTPCIGNRDSHTQRRLFPMLGHYIYDIEGMADAARRLIENEAEYRETVRTAFEAVQFYSLDNTKTRFLRAVEDAKAVKQKVHVPV